MEQPYYDLDDDEDTDTVENICEQCEEAEGFLVTIDGEEMYLCNECESGT
jgi:hypothetical protein